MRYGIISDIHGNLEALEAVLSALEGEQVDEYLCLGDIVGYGADPAACLERVRSSCRTIIAGNHDYAAIGKLSAEYFNTPAAAAVRWTGAQLDEEQTNFLGELPPICEYQGFTLTHGSVLNPADFDYIQSKADAYFSFQLMRTTLCFYGHTHIPVAFFNSQPLTESCGETLRLAPGVKALVNVGSVGQPRDQNPRAAAAIYDVDQEVVWIRRVEYDVVTAAGKIVRAGLPKVLAQRLFYGS